MLQLSTGIYYDIMHTDNTSVTEEQYMAVRNYSTSIGGIALSALPVQFRFVQLDHRGGFCDCWAVANLTITYQGYTNVLK